MATIPSSKSERIRHTDLQSLQRTCDENMSDAIGVWRKGAEAWKRKHYGEAEQHFQVCKEILIGLAGHIGDCAGYDITAKEKSR